MILYDVNKKNLFIEGKEAGEVILRPKEKGIWELLLNHADSAVSRDMMCDEVWGGRYVTNYTINQTINQLRKKIGDVDKNIIITVPRQGYLMDSSNIKITSGNDEEDYLNDGTKQEHPPGCCDDDSDKITPPAGKTKTRIGIKYLIVSFFSLVILYFIMLLCWLAYIGVKQKEMIEFRSSIENEMNIPLYCTEKHMVPLCESKGYLDTCYQNLSFFNSSCDVIKGHESDKKNVKP